MSVPSDEMGHLAMPTCMRGWESSYPRVTFQAEMGRRGGSRRRESFPGGSGIKNSPAMQEPQETWVLSLGWEDPLEESMATYSSILAWRIPKDRGA